MSFHVYKVGQTQVKLRVKLLDSSVLSEPKGLTGLTQNSAGLVISTIRSDEATPVVYTQAAAGILTITTLGTWADPTAAKCRFREVSAANHPGLYELQFENVRFSAGTELIITIKGAVNLVETDIKIQLVLDDPYEAKPANFSLMSINGTGQMTSLLVNGTGAGMISLGGGQVTITQASADKVWATAARVLTAPTNITVGGAINVTSGAVNSVLSLANPVALAPSATSAQLVTDVKTSILQDDLTSFTGVQAGSRLRKLTDSVTLEVTVNDASGTASGFITNALTLSLVNQEFRFSSGPNSGQSRVITTHNTTTGAMTFDEPFSNAPVNGNKAVICGLAYSKLDVKNTIRTDLDANSTKLTSILADTNELQIDWMDGGRLDLLIDIIKNAIDTEILAIKTQTDKLTFTDTGKVDATIQAATDIKPAVANKIADHVLRRRLANVFNSTDGDAKHIKSLAGASAKLTCNIGFSGNQLQIFEADDVTILGIQAATTNANAIPVTSLTTTS